ncbi:MAG TPA: cell division topological specificity factor MinE [Pseudolabrys sp.]|nr:cell division topological specificity factor MinE [Pseudolabrys sp.]
MNFFNLFRREGSAPVARDRLQILLAHERSTQSSPDLLGALRADILAAVARHVEIDPAAVSVEMKRGRKISTLEVEIEIPNGAVGQSGKAARKRLLASAHRPA